MAGTGRCFVAICFALLLTVRALQCYTKIENDCTPSGPTCDTLAPPSANVPQTTTNCSPNATMCGLQTVRITGQGVDLKSESSGCLPTEAGAGFTNGCYDRKDLEKIDKDGAEALRQIEELSGITFDTVEICICNENLCNGSVKSVFAVSVIITSVVISALVFP